MPDLKNWDAFRQSFPATLRELCRAGVSVGVGLRGMCVLDRDHCTVASSEDLSHSKSKSIMIVALCFAALDGGGDCLSELE